MTRLSKIRIKGFRGFNEPYSFDFDHGVILIFGLNGAGKSSLLNAIEFGLFGKVEHFRGEEFTSTRDELINAFSSSREATVELWMKASDGTRYHIKRKKKMGERASILSFRIDEEEFEGRIAQEKIDDLLELTLMDFHSSVYLRQGLLRDIVTGSPKERARAIDSLIGIIDINEILESIPVGYALDNVRNLETMIGKIDAERIGASKTLERELDEMKADLNKRGFLQPITPKAAAKLHDKIVGSLHSLAEKIGVERKEVEKPTATVEELRKAVKELTHYQRYLLKEPGSKISGIQSRKDDIEHFQGALSNKILRLEDLMQEHQDIFRVYGERLTIDDEIKAKMRDLTEAKKEIEAFSENISLHKSALSIVSRSKRDQCPLCKSEFDRTLLMKRIERELKSIKASKEFRKSQQEEKNLEQAISGLRTVLDRFLEIDREFASIKEIVESDCRDLEISSIVPLDDRLFELGLKSFTNQMRILQGRLEDRSFELEKQEKEIREEKNQLLLEAEENIDILRLMIDHLQKKNRLSNLIGILPESFKEKERLEIRLNKVQKYSRNLKILCQYLESSRTKAASEILNALKPQMNLIYTRLRPHPVYDTIDIEVKRGKGRAGKRLFSYMIKAVSKDQEKKTFVKTRFSQAQMNISGLSIFLALVLGAPHKFELIILDEPDQSLDLDHKENLATILRDLQNHKQIIVSTQDEEFQKILLEKLVPPSGERRAIYDFHDWEPEHGPRITRSIQEAPKI